MKRNEIEEKVKEFLIDELEIDEEKIFPEAKLKEDMEIDSLDFVEPYAQIYLTGKHEFDVIRQVHLIELS